MATHSGLDDLSLPVAIIIAAVIIGGSIIFASTRTTAVRPALDIQNTQSPAPSVQQAQAPAPTVNVSLIKASGAQVVGSPTAPIVVAYWYDYQCPVCQRAEETIMSQIMADYVNTGKIRVVLKDLQFLGPDSTTLGLTARAVGEVAPAKFYEWHKAVYDNQGQENTGWATKEKILSITTGVLDKVNADKVLALAASKSVIYRQGLDADKAEGAGLGIRATPSFIIGKKLIVGLVSYAEIKSAIEAALNK